MNDDEMSWTGSDNPRPVCCKEAKCSIEYQYDFSVGRDWTYRHRGPDGVWSQKMFPNNYPTSDFMNWLRSLHAQQEGDGMRERLIGAWIPTSVRVPCVSTGCRVDVRKMDWSYCHTSPSGIETIKTFGDGRAPSGQRVLDWAIEAHAPLEQQPEPLSSQREQAYRAVIKTLTDGLQEIATYDATDPNNSSKKYREDCESLVNMAETILLETGTMRAILAVPVQDIQPVMKRPMNEAWQDEMYVRGGKTL